MKTPAKQTVEILVPIVLFALGALVLTGWYFDIEMLKSANNGQVVMTVPIAFMLILMAFGMKFRSKDVRHVIGFFMIMNVMFMLFTGLFVFVDKNYASYIEIAGKPTLDIPSWGSIVLSIVFVYCTFCSSCALRGGFLIIALSSVATIGHLFNFPALYFCWGKFGTGMAAHTVVAAWHVGVWMVHEGGGWAWPQISLRSQQLFNKDMARLTKG